VSVLEEFKAIAKAVKETPEVDEVLSEFAFNMQFEREGLPEYGLQKIVRYVAIAAFCATKDISLDAFRMSAEDVEAYQRNLIAKAVEAGVPTVVIGENP